MKTMADIKGTWYCLYVLVMNVNDDQHTCCGNEYNSCCTSGQVSFFSYYLFCTCMYACVYMYRGVEIDIA